MSLARCALLVLVVGLELCGCSDHYEGGGRRRELPTGTQTDPPSIGPGDGSSTTGGTSLAEAGAAGADAGAAAVLPRGGSE